MSVAKKINIIKKNFFIHLSFLILIIPLLTIPSQGHAYQALDMTPTDGTLIDDINDPGWANKGYKFTPSKNIHMEAAQWWINLPAGAQVRARVYNTSGTVLAEGTFQTGDGTEQWYRSDIDYVFAAGQTYVLSFFCDQSSVAIHDYKNSPTQPFSVTGFASGIQGVSSSSQSAEEYPGSNNSWTSFMRIVESKYTEKLLTDTTGTFTDNQVVYSSGNNASRGYEFTPFRDINMDAFEWWVNLPSAAQIRARVYDTSGVVLAEGGFTSGNDKEQWYRSNVSYTLQEGVTYILAFSCDQPTTTFFDKFSLSGGYTIPSLGTVVNTRGMSGTDEAYPTNTNSYKPFMRIVETGRSNLTPTTGSLVEGDAVTNTVFWNNKSIEFTASKNITITSAEWWLTLPTGASVRARVYDNSTESLLAEGTYANGNDTEQWYRSDLNFTFIKGNTYVLAFYCDQGSTTPMDRMDSPTQPFDMPGFATGVRHRSSSAEGFPGTVTNSWVPFFVIIEENKFPWPMFLPAIMHNAP